MLVEKREDLPAETKTKPVRVFLYCNDEECDKEMRLDDAFLDSVSPSYRYKCDSCDSMIYSDNKYPMIVLEELVGDSECQPANKS